MLRLDTLANLSVLQRFQWSQESVEGNTGDEMYTWSNPQNPDQKECFIGIAKSKEFSENIKLGTVFISNYHTILNFKDKSVSFAPKL